MAITKHEREQDYRLILDSLKNSIKEIHQYDWNLDLIMSDGSLAIHNAVKAIFEQGFIHGMCSVHVFRNLEKKFFFCKNRR